MHLIEGLERHSALATIREKPSTRKQIKSSSVGFLGSAFSAVYEGRNVKYLPKHLLKCVWHLVDGTEQSFSHAEVRYSGDNVIRLDRFFAAQSAAALKEKDDTANDLEEIELFSGPAITSFDGVLELIDGRGELTLGKLTLSAGGSGVDCVIRQELLSEALKKFKARVRVSGTGIFDGKHYLPQRVNVEAISEIEPSANILNWRGRFRSLRQDAMKAWSHE